MKIKSFGTDEKLFLIVNLGGFHWIEHDYTIFKVPSIDIAKLYMKDIKLARGRTEEKSIVKCVIVGQTTTGCYDTPFTIHPVCHNKCYQCT